MLCFVQGFFPGPRIVSLCGYGASTENGEGDWRGYDQRTLSICKKMLQ